MNSNAPTHLIERFLDGDSLTRDEVESLSAALSHDANLARDVARQQVIGRMLEQMVCAPLDAGQVVRMLPRGISLEDRVVHAIKTSGLTPGEEDDGAMDMELDSMDASTRQRHWVAWPFRLALAAAAAVVLVAGVWWFNQRQDAALGLKVAEVRGKVSGVRGQISDLKSQIVVSSELGVGGRTALRPGDVLWPGDGIDVGADGYAKLAYPDTTQVELRQNTRLRVTLGSGTGKDAKRLALDGGTLVCTAAPQKTAFEIATRHGVARVVGTRFRLAVAELKTTLAVLEGKVDLCQGGKILEVSSGESAVASEDGLALAQAQAQGGQVWAWGDNQCGQLGDGTTVSRRIPVQVPCLVDVTTVAAGTAHSVALRSDHTVLAWGWNDKGQLGDGTTNNRAVPVPVRLPNEIPLSNIVAVVAGGSHSTALTVDGRVWAWGDNEFGQLGDGTTLRRLTPVTVPGLAGVIALAAGGSHTVILKDDHTVWTWGRNDAGQLGDGTTTDRHAPVQVKRADGSPLNAAAIAAGRSHTAALIADGRVWGWGSNRNGQLGDDLAPRLTPGPVALTEGESSFGVLAIAAAGDRTVALMADRTVWSRGIPDQVTGILDGYISHIRKSDAQPRGDADVNVTNGQGGQFRPMQIKQADGGAFTGVTAIVVGAYHAVALTADGGVWTWGRMDDMFAARGTEAVAPRDPRKRGEGLPAPSPVRIRMAGGIPLSGVIAVAVGGGHTVVVVTEFQVLETAILNKTTGGSQ